MTILEMCFNIDRVTGFGNYDKNYDYWSVDEDGMFLFMSYRENPDYLCGVSKYSPSDVIVHIDYIWDNEWQDKPLFIPYEEIKPYENITIEFENSIVYEGCQKYPLVCVRGECNKQCGNKDIKPYCFHNLPCFNNKPDWNVYSCKYPNAFDLIFSVVDWIKECKSVHALVVLFEFEPSEYQRNLDFDYCTALLVNGNTIKVIDDAEKAYKEYNAKYPTEDRQIERSISRPEDGFYFRF